MFHLHLICLGKLKETFWREAEAEYLKRLGAFAKIKITELREESFGEKDSPEVIIEKEAKKILSALPKDDFIIALDPNGNQFSSEKFALHLDRIIAEQNSKITFIIGGPLGLHESILKIAQLKFSLSALTFTHQMARVILWEQIYRAQMISAERAYHH